MHGTENDFPILFERMGGFLMTFNLKALALKAVTFYDVIMYYELYEY